MDFAYLKRVLEVAVNRSDMSEFYGDWVNQALRTIYQDVSWNCMRTNADVVISANTSFVSLPSDFKELTKAQSPVCARATDDSLIPVDVTRREDIIRLAATRLPYIADRVYIDNDGDGWTLCLLNNATTDLTFNVSYYRLLPSLEADTDTNYILTSYEEMVKAKIKAVGFSEINDPLGDAWEARYRMAKTKAAADDANRYTAGRRMQMGG